MSEPVQFDSAEHAFIVGQILGVLSREVTSNRADSQWTAVRPEVASNPNDPRGFDYRPFITLEAFGKRFRLIIAEVQ